MTNLALILAPGFEEVEALTAADLLRRASIGCALLSLEGGAQVRGSHGITVLADGAFDRADWAAFDGIILPGGMPGTAHLAESEALLELLRHFEAQGKLTAAICAAPTVLAKAGLLHGRRACCYPGRESELEGALVEDSPVTRDGTVICSRGLGTAIPFALAIAEYFQGEEKARALAQAVVYKG